MKEEKEKRRNIPRIQHKHNTVSKLIDILSTNQESLDTQLLKPKIRLRVGGSTHDADHLCSKLKWCSFEGDSSWCDIETETEICCSS
jgi:hypothetical protein